MIIVNLFGCPGAGKSTGAAYIFSQLKNAGVNAELVTEFAKDKVWEESKEAFNNQAYLFGKQYFRISRCQDKVDVIVTDSPLLLTILYNNNEVLDEDFDNMVYKVFKSYKNMNYLLVRDKPYNPVGRFQTETESDALLPKLENLLQKYHIGYIVKKGNMNNYDYIIEEVLNALQEKK